jgi:hypothetical protein
MRIYVKAIPKSSKKEITKISEGEYKVHLTAPPEKGKANEMLIKMLADYFNVSKSAITIVGGKTTRIKIVDIAQ